MLFMPHNSWEIWLDTQLSPAIAKWLAELTGFVIKSSYSLNLHYQTDVAIYNQAKQQGNVILISKDADFPELISRLGSPPKLVVIKKGNCDNKTMWAFIKPHIEKAITLLITTEIDIVEIV